MAFLTQTIVRGTDDECDSGVCILNTSGYGKGMAAAGFVTFVNLSGHI